MSLHSTDAAFTINCSAELASALHRKALSLGVAPELLAQAIFNAVAPDFADPLPSLTKAELVGIVQVEQERLSTKAA
jgi:hypothetical protein